MLTTISTNVVELIPYHNFKEKIRIVQLELRKDRHVEVWGKYIYSAKKDVSK